MKRIALLTAIAMAAPVAAFAQPPRAEVTVNWTHERYDHYNNSHWARDFHGRWQPLARAESGATDRQFIAVNGAGRFSKLRIEGVRGQPMVQKVAVEFADKTSQAVDINEALPNGAGTVIDLNGGERRINRIIVYTDPHARGSYSVYGAG